jgi:hypothetical protein
VKTNRALYEELSRARIDLGKMSRRLDRIEWLVRMVMGFGVGVFGVYLTGTFLDHAGAAHPQDGQGIAIIAAIGTLILTCISLWSIFKESP